MNVDSQLGISVDELGSGNWNYSNRRNYPIIYSYIFHSLFTIHWLTIKQQLSIIVQCNPTKNAHMPMLKHQELFHYFAVYHRPSLFYIGSTAAAVLEVSGYLTDWRFFSSSCTLRPDVDH